MAIIDGFQLLKLLTLPGKVDAKRSQSSIGITEGRPCAHWNGSWHCASCANNCSHSDFSRGSPNFMAPGKQEKNYFLPLKKYRRDWAWMFLTLSPVWGRSLLPIRALLMGYMYFVFQLGCPLALHFNHLSSYVLLLLLLHVYKVLRSCKSC